MARYVIDEDLPRSLARALRDAGLDAQDVRDIGLRGASDRTIFEYSVAERRVLVTGDRGFSNTLAFPLGMHAGIVLVRFPNEVSASTSNAAVMQAVRAVRDMEMDGALLIVEPGRVRLRRPSPRT